MKEILLIIQLIFTIPTKLAETKLADLGLIERKEVIIPEISVTLTTYKAIEGETDSTPLITASGFKIKPNKAREHRIIAVSRDLKKRFKWGDKVIIKGAGKYNGEYRVHDLMNKRYKKRIDVLIGGGDKQTKIRNVKISPIKLEDSSK
jgi:3D (Asp-Asp-Asp) domain-containing protein